MVSMEVLDLVRSGSDKPNSSQRIFGLETGRFFLLPALLLFQTEEMLITNSFCVAFGSCPGTSMPISTTPNSSPDQEHAALSPRKRGMSKLDCGINRAETVTTVRKRKDRKRSTYELLL